MFDDLRDFAWADQCDVIAINWTSTLYLKPIVGIVSLHPDLFHKLIKKRANKDGDMDFMTFGPIGKADSGTSSLLAVRVALFLGYTRIVLVGVPFESNLSFVDEKGGLGTAEDTRVSRAGNKWSIYHQGWRDVYPEIKDNVRSVSGWTRGLLGEPTEEWIAGS